MCTTPTWVTEEGKKGRREGGREDGRKDRRRDEGTEGLMEGRKKKVLFPTTAFTVAPKKKQMSINKQQTDKL